jgi:hypothetical protein
MSDKVALLVKLDWLLAMRSDFLSVLSQFAHEMAPAAKYLNV